MTNKQFLAHIASIWATFGAVWTHLDVPLAAVLSYLVVAAVVLNLVAVHRAERLARGRNH